MSEVITVQDLENLKKHEIFEAEVITGKAGGLSTGANINSATNAVTGQIQDTLPKILSDLGMQVQPWPASVGGILTSPSQIFLNDIFGSTGKDDYYAWVGIFPKTVAPGTDPALPGSGYVKRSDKYLKVAAKEALRRSYAEAGYTLVVGSFETGGTMASAIDVLLHEVSGKAYSGSGPFPQTIPAGTSPGAGFTDRSNERLRAMLASTAGTSMIGSPTGPLDQRLHALKRASPIETRFAGGADPTGVADSTDALEACINYCAPFEWKGSVAATKAAMGAVVAAMSGFGKFRITRPLKVNPFLVIISDHVGGFFGQNGGFQIIADFTDKNAFALDTAPYNSAGVRELGRMGSRNDWDGGNYTGCPGVSMFGIDVVVAAGRNLRGTFNRGMSQQSHIHRCSFIGGNIGVQNSVCWGGSMRDNHVTARAIPFLNGNDVTVDDQQNNYLSVLGTKPTVAEFDYPSYPDASLIGKTCCVFNSYGHPIHKNNIWEGAQIGAMCTNGASIHLEDNYAEAISEFILAAHTVSVKLSLSWLIAASAKLLHVRGATVEVDISHVAYLTTVNTALADFDNFSRINLTGLQTAGSKDAILKLPFCAIANYDGVTKDGTREIYISSTGNDANTGLVDTSPVLTLQGAFERTQPGVFNRINLSGTIGTKYTYTSGNTTNKEFKLDTVEIDGKGTAILNVGESFGELHSLPMGIARVRFVGMATVNIATPAADYKPLVPCNGVVNLEIEGGQFNGGTLMGVKYGRAGMCNLTARNATLACALQHNGGTTNAFSWIDTAINTSVAGGSVGGAGSKKISSVLYP